MLASKYLIVRMKKTWSTPEGSFMEGKEYAIHSGWIDRLLEEDAIDSVDEELTEQLEKCKSDGHCCVEYAADEEDTECLEDFWKLPFVYIQTQGATGDFGEVGEYGEDEYANFRTYKNVLPADTPTIPAEEAKIMNEMSLKTDDEIDAEIAAIDAEIETATAGAEEEPFDTLTYIDDELKKLDKPKKAKKTTRRKKKIVETAALDEAGPEKAVTNTRRVKKNVKH